MLGGLGLAAVLAPLYLVVVTRGLVSSNATVLGVQRSGDGAPHGGRRRRWRVLAALLATALLTRDDREPGATR